MKKKLEIITIKVFILISNNPKLQYAIVLLKWMCNVLSYLYNPHYIFSILAHVFNWLSNNIIY